MLNDPAADVVLGQRVLREHVASVYDTYSASTLTHLCFVAVFGAILYAQLHDPRLLFWMAGMVLADVYVFFTPRWICSASTRPRSMRASRRPSPMRAPITWCWRSRAARRWRRCTTSSRPAAR